MFSSALFSLNPGVFFTHPCWVATSTFLILPSLLLLTCLVKRLSVSHTKSLLLPSLSQTTLLLPEFCDACFVPFVLSPAAEDQQSIVLPMSQPPNILPFLITLSIPLLFLRPLISSTALLLITEPCASSALFYPTKFVNRTSSEQSRNSTHLH